MAIVDQTNRVAFRVKAFTHQFGDGIDFLFEHILITMPGHADEKYLGHASALWLKCGEFAREQFRLAVENIFLREIVAQNQFGFGLAIFIRFAPHAAITKRRCQRKRDDDCRDQHGRQAQARRDAQQTNRRDQTCAGKPDRGQIGRGTANDAIDRAACDTATAAPNERGRNTNHIDRNRDHQQHLHGGERFFRLARRICHRHTCAN